MKHQANPISRLFNPFARSAASLWSEDSGSSVVEFALIAPFVLLILTATFDIGMIIQAKFNLDARITAAANYAQINGASIEDAGATTFAGKIASLVSGGSTDVEANVVLNNAASAAVDNGTLTTNDTLGQMAQCYCPSRVAGKIQWGIAQTCLSPCADGSTAGKFIVLDATTPHTSLFRGYGITPDGMILTDAVVRIE